MTATWNAQLLRLTLFPADAIALDAMDAMWSLAVEEPADIDERKPREGTRRQVGNVDDITIELQIQPGRIDWHIVPRVIEGEPAPWHFGPAQETIGQFEHRFMSWLSTISFPVIRLAVGAIFLSPVEGRLPGYRAINDLTKSVHIDTNDDVSDVLFQINRPKTIPDYDQKINCIQKWSVAAVRSFRGIVSAGSSSVVAPLSAEAFYCRLELDLSTPAIPKSPLENQKIAPIFRQLTRIGLSIAENGEMA